MIYFYCQKGTGRKLFGDGGVSRTPPSPNKGGERMKRILVVEDDLGLSAGLCFDLEADDYLTIPAYTYKKAMAVFQDHEFDLVVMDVNLPDGNGFDLCREMKAKADVPVIFLTANDMEEDVLNGLELGAEDYITKPFSMNIFRKKVEMILRRNEKKQNGNVYSDGTLRIDFESLTALKNGEKLVITPNEYKILKLLTANAGNVLTRQVLLERLWDNEGNFIDEHTLTVNMTRLRNKIEDEQRKYIKTIYGMGYVWIGGKDEKKE